MFLSIEFLNSSDRKPRKSAADYQTAYGIFQKKLLQRFLNLNSEEKPLLYLHGGLYRASKHNFSYFQLLDRSALKLLLRDYSKKVPLEVEWAEVGWWFRSNNKKDIAGSSETPEEACTASKKSTVVAPTKMKRIDSILGDLI